VLEAKGEAAQAARVLSELSEVVIGKHDAKELLLIALLCGGHVLVEGKIGTAKTLLIKTFARLIGGTFKRVQCTADMLPADVTGFYAYDAAGTPRFVPGPIFANVLMADELNRATPRAQSAFLEGMQEYRVTLEGVDHVLPQPFMLVASQIPTGAEGTYALPQTQMDRFMFRVGSDYPSPDEEQTILAVIDRLEAPQVEPTMGAEEVVELRERVKAVYVEPDLQQYIVDLVNRLRHHPDTLAGPGPRGSIALYKSARASAFLGGRDFVLPDDIKRWAGPALEHRLVVRPEAEADGQSAGALVAEALAETPVPK
jgi:MoxR-like ATPase